MKPAKIEISVGCVSFSGEGDQDWLAKQLDKVLEKASTSMITPNQEHKGKGKEAISGNKPDSVANQPLATFLRSKASGASQSDKFLATAIWVHDKEDKSRLKTGDISGALRNANQNKLSNASQYLNENVSKGFCEKDGKDFFVTPEGRENLGV